MFRMIQITLAVVALVAFSVVAQAGTLNYGSPSSWDILNESYGNGSGQTAVNSDWTTPSGWGTTTPTEADSSGKAKLTLSSSDHFWLTKPSLPGMVTGNADYTMECQVTTPTKSEVYLAWSENNSLSGDDWNHMFIINGTYSGPQTDTLQDYNWGRTNGATGQAPLGFNGSATHTYRFVRNNGTDQLYLDNSATPLLTLLDQSAGAVGDHVYMELGLYEASGASSAEVDMSYLRMASGAYAPTPTPEPSSFMLLAIGIVSLVAYAWRKRR